LNADVRSTGSQGDNSTAGLHKRHRLVGRLVADSENGVAGLVERLHTQPHLLADLEAQGVGRDVKLGDILGQRPGCHGQEDKDEETLVEHRNRFVVRLFRGPPCRQASLGPVLQHCKSLQHNEIDVFTRVPLRGLDGNVH